MEKNYNNNLIKLIFKWKIQLLIVFLVSIILSSLFSSSIFIKPKYESSAIIYPSNLIPYSSETPTEQMLQLFRSDYIMDGIIKKFNLCYHYNIDSSKTHYRSTLKKAYETNVSIDKTQYESVVINVLDIEAETACEIVKEMINLFNLKVRNLQRDKTKEIIKIWDG